MPELDNLLLFLVAALAIAVTPGPGIFYVAARTLAGGRRAGLASSLQKERRWWLPGLLVCGCRAHVSLMLQEVLTLLKGC